MLGWISSGASNQACEKDFMLKQLSLINYKSLILELRCSLHYTSIGTRWKSKKKCSLQRTRCNCYAQGWPWQLLPRQVLPPSKIIVRHQPIRRLVCLFIFRNVAYIDSPQVIGYGATISAPHMHAAALKELEPFILEKPSARILDVGSGSGYLTACLSELVRADGGQVD